MADSFLKTDAVNNLLLVTADTYTRHLDASDISSRATFGDARTATFLTKDSQNRLTIFAFGSDRSLAKAFMCEHGGERSYAQKEEAKETNSPLIHMNGPEVFSFTLKVVPKTFEKLLTKANLSIDDIDYFVFHQANSFMLEHLRQKLNLPKDKFFIDLASTGNTVSSTIPIALNSLITTKRLSPGMKLLLLGFGVRASWAGCILQWHQNLPQSP